MNNKRVVITGCGVISCVGNNLPTFWDNIVNGRSGIGLCTRLDLSEYRSRIAGEVKNFDFTQYVAHKDVRRYAEFCQYAIAASDEALANAGLPDVFGNEDCPYDPNRFGAVVASGIGALRTLEEQYDLLKQRGPAKVSPFMIPKMIVDMAAGAISIRHNARGPNMGIVTACASSTHAIGEAMWMIKRGDADVILAGGCESTIAVLGFAGFGALQALSTRNDDPQRASRPFDKNRDGFVMSEGAGLLVLESYEHAVKRGANILAELIGYGATADAFHITAPAEGGEGAARAIKVALEHAKIDPSEIDYVNAHGTSTQLNDKCETAAIKTALGLENAYKVAVSSTKGTIGHGLGAAGALETIICVKAINEGIVPPTINYETPDPECDLDITPNVAKERKIRIALNTNLGFGGHNAALLIKKFEN